MVKNFRDIFLCLKRKHIMDNTKVKIEEISGQVPENNLRGIILKNKFQIVLDNNVYCSKMSILEKFKEKYKDKIKLLLTDTNISEMIEYKDRLKIAIKVKDKLFGPPRFIVGTELNGYFNKFNPIKYYIMKQKLYKMYFDSETLFKKLLETNIIFDDEQVEYIKNTREEIKRQYEQDWLKSKNVINAEISKLKKEEGIPRSKIVKDVIEKYFFDKNTFNLVMERFGIEKIFPEYKTLFLDNIWVHKIKTISTFMKFYVRKMEQYVNYNFTNVKGADLLDLDYTVFFPYIDFFITENKKHFLHGIDNTKIKTFDEFEEMLKNK
jgi:hypothetical protein